jgi:two-component system sensor histidine kinase KdpD
MRRMIEALIDQASLALERTRLVGEASEARGAVEGEKLRSALLSSVSHDLRTPLSSIIGSITALRKLGTKMPKTSRDDLMLNIEEEASRLSRFVTNLLDMTRLESGGVVTRREKCDLVELVGAIIRHARELMSDRIFDARLPSEPVHFLGDPTLVDQLLLNLLENADRYADRGTPVIISVGRQLDRAVIAVEDRGPGIPPEDQERVFEKFYRVHAGDGRPAGTGLGLAICRAIATAMNGTIRVESPIANGRGSRFVVSLPAAD